jgi:predicted transport protein
MPLFALTKTALRAIPQKPFPSEKMLQRLIESNLDTVFKSRMVATEYSTGTQHAGRIDTLALSEDNNPVIIEYKNAESSDLINQSLFYLAWIQDHKGDFQVAAQQALGDKTPVDWSAVRVICITPNYRKYDLHAARVMGAAVELWTYRLFENDVIYLEEVLRKSDAGVGAAAGSKNPIMVAAGKKAALVRATSTYTFDEHLQGKPDIVKQLALAVNEFATGLDSSIEMVPKKFYVAYKTSQNILCLEVKQKKLHLYLKLDPKRFGGPKGLSRDVSAVGHYGTGDLEITVTNQAELEQAKPFIKKAYEEVGG